MDERLKRLLPWLAPGFIGAAICAGIAMLSFAGTRAGNIDDAFILLVYVKHLAQQGVIAWNVGGPHVDGFTSFLDLLLKAMLVRATGADPIRVAFWVTLVLHMLVGVLGFVGILWLTQTRFGTARDRRESLGLALLGGALLASNSAISEGSTFLLETPLVIVTAFALLGTWLFAEQFTPRIFWAIVIEAILVSLARPEGLALGAAILLLTLFDRERPVAPDLRPVAAVFPIAIGAYYLWHWRYFGYLAPNTYYAKTSSVRLNEIGDGFRYLFKYLSTRAGFGALLPVLVAPFAAFSTEWKDPTARRRFLVIEGAALGWIVLVIWSGGDSYAGGRLLALPIALGAFGVVMAAAATTGTVRRRLVIGTAALASLQCLGVLGSFDRAEHTMAEWPERQELDRYRCSEAFGNALAVATSGGTVAESDYQMLKYYGESLHVIDLQGLSDPEIAHRPESGEVRWGKFSYADVVRLKPRVWLWGYKVVSQPSPVDHVLRPISSVPVKELFTSRAVHGNYIGYHVPRPDAATAATLEDLYVPVSLKLCHTYYNMMVRSDATGPFEALADKGFIVGRGVAPAAAAPVDVSPADDAAAAAGDEGE